MNKIIIMTKYFLVFLFSLTITFQFGGFLYYLSYDYERGDFYKYYDMNYISTIYHNSNIFLGNCNYIKDYYLYKIESSSFDKNNNVEELIQLIKSCDNFKNDSIFLSAIKEDKFELLDKLSDFEKKVLISKYWFVIKNDKYTLDKIKKISNENFINLLNEKFT